MNILLTDEQILYIQQDLKRQGITAAFLKDELLDHIYCAVEQEMTDGLPFDEAYVKVLQNFGPDGLQVVQQNTMRITKRNSQLIKNITAFTASIAASLLLFALVSNAKSRTDAYPILYTPASIYNHQIEFECHTKNLYTGIDYLIPEGTPVIATATGRILSVKNDSIHYGKYITIDHNGEYQTLYAHLSACVVYKGQYINTGEIIGYSGKTGAAIKPHLHYEHITFHNENHLK